jgi:hypothetical protein
VQQSAVGLGRRRGVLRSSSCCARPRDHLLQLNVHLPWEVEVVCIGHWLGRGASPHQHFTTRCVLDARRGGAFLGASVTTARTNPNRTEPPH